MNQKIIQNINKLAYPILLNYLLLNIFELLDKAIIGHYSLESFALIGVVAPPIYEITGAFGVLSVAFNILAAEQKGKGNQDELEKLFIISKRITILIGAVFVMFSFVGGKFFFRTIYGQNGAQLEELLSYFYPNTFTVVLNMLVFLYSAYYRNKLCTKISFYSTAISTAVNLFFDFCLVHGFMGMPELGIAGAAWGSVIGLVAGLMVYQVPYFQQKSVSKVKTGKSRTIVKTIFRLYPTLFGQEFLEGTLFTIILSAAVSWLEIEQMAVYNLLDSIVSIVSVSTYAYATAIQTYSLQHRASGNMKLAEKYLKCGSIFTSAVMFLLCTVTFLFRFPIMHWLVTDSAVISVASEMMLFAFLPIFPKIFCQIYMEYLQGSGEDRFVFLCTVITTILSGVGVILAAHYFKLYGIYIVMAMQYLILSILYRKHRTTCREEEKQ